MALNNRWTTQELYPLISPELPIFLYFPLILTWVTSAVMGDRSVVAAQRTAGQMSELLSATTSGSLSSTLIGRMF
jgi:hypothetical protein